jgi:hypothetical protein
LKEFPLAGHWAAQLIATVVPPSKFSNAHVGHRDAVGSQLVQAVWFRNGSLESMTERIRVAYRLLEQAFDKHPQVLAQAVHRVFHRWDELQQREASLAQAAHETSRDDLEAYFASYLELYQFSYEQYFRTLASAYVNANAIHTRGSACKSHDPDGRVHPSKVQHLERVVGLKQGTLTDGLNSHLRNSAAHHRYTILSDDRIRLWDVDQSGTYSWGPVEWSFWEFRTHIYALSNTCSVLLLGLAMFDIAYGPTLLARGWVGQDSPRPKRRDIVKSELAAMADLHGFVVEKVAVKETDVLTIHLRVQGQTITNQVSRIIAGGHSNTKAYLQRVGTEWGALRNQVYGFLQMTLDVHDGYPLVKVVVTGTDGKTNFGELHTTLEDRKIIRRGREPVEAIQGRVQLDSLANEQIPVIIRGPLMPVN